MRCALVFAVLSSGACSDSGPTDSGPSGPGFPVVGIGDGDATVVVASSLNGDGDTGDGDLAGDGDVPVDAVPLEICDVAGAATRGLVGASPVIDDFEDGDAEILGNGLRGWWYSFGDESGGTQTPDPWLPEAVGRASSSYALHVTGGGYTQWGSVNSLTLAANDQHDCLFDGSAYDGITFWVRGTIDLLPSKADYVAEVDREILKVQFSDKRVVPLESGGTCDPFYGECWNSYRYRVPLTGCWTRHAVRFSELVQDEWGQQFGEIDASALVYFGFEVGRYQTFDYWVDDIEFFVGETPEVLEDCNDQGLGGAAGVGP